MSDQEELLTHLQSEFVKDIVKLSVMVEEGRLSSTASKQVFSVMYDEKERVKKLINTFYGGTPPVA